jgi:Na+-translocating ferredoxin:NAD+ oxidoreductase RNF subunit RnfB
MDKLTHGFGIDWQKCRGCLSCMRVCPTHAIRVKDAKAQYRSDSCIDCGVCLTACPSNAIFATTTSIEDISRFEFKVAVPSPVLFGQFPTGITPAQIVDGLLALGFDDVWDYSVDINLVSRAIQQYVDQWTGPTPLISISCPVVVRLVQVSYPAMVNQLIPIQLAREIAGREAKRRYSARLGLREDQIAAIYITPCQAKTISILQPAEGVVSNLDGALGFHEVYNGVLACASLKKGNPIKSAQCPIIRNAGLLRMHVSEGIGRLVQQHRYLRVTGLSNTIQVFDDIEKGKLRNVGFLEAHSCWNGCAGGNLTVANVYVAGTTLRSLARTLPEMDPATDAEIERRFPTEDFSLKAPIRPRAVRGTAGNLKERVQMRRRAEEVVATLPGLDCGLCGAPTCRELARDVSMNDASKDDCVFLSKSRLQDLQRVYVRKTA